MVKDIEKKIDELLEQMTLDEKIGQLNQTQINVNDVEKTKEQVRSGKTGSLILAMSGLAGNSENEHFYYDTMKELQKIAVEESRLHIPLIYGRDVIHGYNVMFPIPLAMASSFNMELVEKCYRLIAQAAASDGIHWTFTPMLDLARDARWGRMAEGPGEDPYLGAQMAKAVVKGVQGDDVSDINSLAACAKHFIGYGASEGGRDYHHVELTDYTLRNYYLPAFKAAVDAGVQTVMSSFNEIGGQPVTSSKQLLTDLLKDELGFDGFIIGDWDVLNQLKYHGVAENDYEACKQAINAGLDMDMMSEIYAKELKNAVLNGEVSEAVVDEAVRRVLRVKFRCGLFENALKTTEMPDFNEYLQLSEEMAQECMVLLKNKDNVLPLDKNKKIALIGPMLDERRPLLGCWSLNFDISLVKNYRECFTEVFGKENIVASESHLWDEQLIKISGADVVVLFLGEGNSMTGETHSLANIEISDTQKQLAEFAHSTGKPVIAIVTAGRPLGLQKLESYVDAILYTWHSGTGTAPAAAKIIAGEVCPSGHLPATLPRVTGQLPLYYNVPLSSHELWNGYYRKDCQRNYIDAATLYMYPFGYGLSYTDFTYSNIRVSEESIRLEELNNGKKFIVQADVQNAGNFDAKATVQLYITDKCATMKRSMRELKAFKKLAFQKNTMQTIEFELGFEELAFYNANGDFVVEKGEFDIYIGDNCMTSLKTSIRIQ